MGLDLRAALATLVAVVTAAGADSADVVASQSFLFTHLWDHHRLRFYHLMVPVGVQLSIHDW